MSEDDPIEGEIIFRMYRSWGKHYCKCHIIRKIEAFARCSGPLSREGSLLCHTCGDTGPLFFRSHSKDRPILSPFRHTEGCGGSILTWILTGPHSVAFYDTGVEFRDQYNSTLRWHRLERQAPTCVRFCYADKMTPSQSSQCILIFEIHVSWGSGLK
jgi:hypothetical protein